VTKRVFAACLILVPATANRLLCRWMPSTARRIRYCDRLGYHRDAGGLRVAVHGDLGHLVGATGLFTTARDLLRWEQNFVTMRVGDPALVTAMQTPTTLTGGDTSWYGFGLEIGQNHHLRTIGHGGGDPGYGAYVVRYPNQGLAVAVLCNLDNIGLSVGALTRRVADIYLGNVPAAPSERGAKPAPPRVFVSAEEPR
jgi:CubicO group peptidase (beta-lactamase class C family)